MCGSARRAYIDLNLLRAGVVQDPADYCWSSYGEAVGGGPQGNGKRAREDLVRAWMAHKGRGADARHWDGKENIHAAYRAVLLAEGEERADWPVDQDGEVRKKVRRKGMAAGQAREERERRVAERRVELATRLRGDAAALTRGAGLFSMRDLTQGGQGLPPA